MTHLNVAVQAYNHAKAYCKQERQMNMATKARRIALSFDQIADDFCRRHGTPVPRAEGSGLSTAAGKKDKADQGIEAFYARHGV